MSSLLQSSLHRICWRQNTARYYADSAHVIAQHKWRLQGVPRPRSILDDDDTPVDLSEDNEAVNGGRANTLPVHMRAPPDKPTPHEYKAHRETLRKAFPEGWSPRRKLSREAMDALRQLHRTDSEVFSTPVLADKFEISPEAVSRILKSKWEPSAEKRTALVVKERKKKEEFWNKAKAEKKSAYLDLRELKKHLRQNNYEKHNGRTDGYQGKGRGVGETDGFQLR